MHNGSPVQFLCMVRIWVETPIEEFLTRFKHEAHHIISDIPNYTNIQPVIQISQIKM